MTSKGRNKREKKAFTPSFLQYKDVFLQYMYKDGFICKIQGEKVTFNRANKVLHC